MSEEKEVARKEQLNQMVLKAVSDPELRAKLFEDPAATAKTMGVELADVERDALKKIDLKSIARNVDEMLAAGRLPGRAMGSNIIFNY